MTFWRAALVSASVVLLGGLLVLLLVDRSSAPGPSPVATGSPTPGPDDTIAASPSAPSPEPEPSPSPEPADRGLVGASTVGEPWGEGGLLSFRGNPTRTWYGQGPVPDEPEVLWRYPDSRMCTEEVTGYEDVPVDGGETPASDASTDEGGASPSPAEPSPADSPATSPSPQPSPRTSPSPITKLWCGTGWTGQPAVWERPDGLTEVVFGGYDGAVHFLDGATGQPTRPSFQTGDMIKGSVTLDPDGLPLLYFGSRDGFLRVVALDRPEPTELWRLASHPQGVWNNDWDGNPVVIGDLLLEGGEDSWFYAIQLNKAPDGDGLVQVAPEVLVEVPGFNDQLFDDVGDGNVSIENSVAVFEDRVYFANSGGRVVGLDLSRVEQGVAPVVFDHWVGDDVDASIVIDEEGMLYVAAELERVLPRAEEVGQLVKLDPYATGDPQVWGVAVPPRGDIPGDAGGIWGTPALHGEVLYVTTHPGDLLVVDRATGEVVWEERIGYHEWSSPVVVGDTLVVGACQAGGLLAWSITDPRAPRELWHARQPSGACIESTPAVWDGRIYVGSRDGYFYAFE